MRRVKGYVFVFKQNQFKMYTLCSGLSNLIDENIIIIIIIIIAALYPKGIFKKNMQKTNF